MCILYNMHVSICNVCMYACVSICMRVVCVLCVARVCCARLCVYAERPL